MSSTKLRVGIIGCGNIGGGFHLPAWLAEPEVDVQALADPSEATLQVAGSAAGLGEDRLYSEPLELIGRPDIDVVDICTPQHLRRELIAEAARQGKHVLCEKPLATVPAEGAAAVSAAATGGITLAMVHNYLSLPEIRAALRVIESGEIGDVRTVTVNYLGIVDVPGHAGYAPQWRHDLTRAGGGVLMDILHGVYVAEGLLGAKLERVSAYADSVDPRSNVEELALCRFETSRNAALVNIAWGTGPGGIDVTGTKGRIAATYKDGGTWPWSPLERVLVTTEDGTRTELEAADTGADDGYAALGEAFKHVIHDFVTAVRSGAPPAATGADGQRILEATVGALRSASTGELMEIPLDRDDPVFQRGVVGVHELDLPEWSPALRRSLYRETMTTTGEKSA